MNVIKKYWDSVYIYVLLLIPGLCMCAGAFWTGCKLFGLYPDLDWTKIIIFDCSHIFYLAISLYFIIRNKKDPSYIPEHLTYVKGYIALILFVQYNVLMHLFASVHVWECTPLFLLLFIFFFDSKLTLLNIAIYGLSLLVAHIIRPEDFLPLGDDSFPEALAYRILMFVLISLSIMIVVYFIERFLVQAKESHEENVHLIEKQLRYYKDMDLMDTELRKFRHDIKNHFICMESLFNNGKTEELQEYFKDLQESFSFEQKMHFSGNDIIDAILHHDLTHYCNKNVKVTTYGKLPTIETVSAMDLCTLFSNLLSNAIASANKCVDTDGDTPPPQILIHFSSGNRYFCIEVANSVTSQSISKKKNDRNHGHGISKIKEVLEKYNGKFEQIVEHIVAEQSTTDSSNAQHTDTAQQMITIKIYLPI